MDALQMEENDQKSMKLSRNSLAQPTHRGAPKSIHERSKVAATDAYAFASKMKLMQSVNGKEKKTIMEIMSKHKCGDE